MSRKASKTLKLRSKLCANTRLVQEKLGAVGFCLGGQLAYLTAARTDIDAAIGYYGVNIENLLSEADNISKPLMLHIAEKDQFVPKQAQEKIIKALKPHDKIILHLYPETRSCVRAPRRRALSRARCATGQSKKP